MKKTELLKELRLDKRLTQANVAKEMKVSQAYYSLVERGERPREIDDAIQIVNMMRQRGKRTSGGEIRVGRLN